MAEAPIYTYVIFFAFLLTMVCFGAYRPQLPLIFLTSIYAAFIGLVLYLILALSDPFQGAISVKPKTFEAIVEMMLAEL